MSTQIQLDIIARDQYSAQLKSLQSQVRSTKAAVATANRDLAVMQQRATYGRNNLIGSSDVRRARDNYSLIAAQARVSNLEASERIKSVRSEIASRNQSIKEQQRIIAAENKQRAAFNRQQQNEIARADRIMAQRNQAQYEAYWDRMSGIHMLSQQVGSMAGQVLGGIKRALDFGAEFSSMMIQVGAIAKETNGITAGGQLSEQALKIGALTPLTSNQVASGMKFLAMAGMNTEQIQAATPAAAYLAVATQTQLEGKGGTADIMTNVMRMFGMGNSQTEAMTGADMLTKGVTSANISIDDLAQSIKYAGAQLRSSGVSLDKSIAQIGTLGNAGIQGSMAGTALANMYRFTSRSVMGTNRLGRERLDMLGLTDSDLYTPSGQMRDMGEIARLVQTRMEAMGIREGDRGAIGADIFGVRGQRAADILGRNLESYNQLLVEIRDNSAGLAKEVSDLQFQGLKGRMDQFSSEWENAMVSFSKAIEPVIIPILQFGSGIAKAVNWVARSSGVVGTFVMGFGTLYTSVIWLGSKIYGLYSNFMLATRAMQEYTISLGAATRANYVKAQSETAGAVANNTSTMSKTGANMGMMGMLMGAQATRWKYFTDKAGRWRRREQGTKGPGVFSKAPSLGNRMLGTMVGTGPRLMSRAGIVTIGGILGRAMLGPWGLGLMALSTIVPMIYSSVTDVKKNTDSIEENTRQIKNSEYKGLSSREIQLATLRALERVHQELKNGNARGQQPQKVVISGRGRTMEEIAVDVISNSTLNTIPI